MRQVMTVFENPCCIITFSHTEPHPEIRLWNFSSGWIGARKFIDSNIAHGIPFLESSVFWTLHLFRWRRGGHSSRYRYLAASKASSWPRHDLPIRWECGFDFVTMHLRSSFALDSVTISPQWTVILQLSRSQSGTNCSKDTKNAHVAIRL